MVQKDEGRTAQAVVIGGIGGTLLGVTIGALLRAKPAEAAPPDEKLDYLLDCQAAIVQLLGQMVAGNQEVIGLLQQWLAAQGVAPPGVEVTVKTPWVAKTPEQLYSNPIRVVGTFDSDMMVDWTEGKRLLIMVQSSLNQACSIQLVGNYVDDMNLAVDINAALACPANSNISIGPAWDDWHPFIGVRITTAAAPTAGILNIFAVVQD